MEKKTVVEGVVDGVVDENKKIRTNVNEKDINVFKFAMFI